MQRSLFSYAGIIVGLILLIGIGYFVVRDLGLVTVQSSEDTAGLANLDADYIPVEEQGAENLTTPDLDRPYTAPDNLPEDIQQDSTQRVADAVEALKKDANNPAQWLTLAVYRKASADYDGAEEIWLYYTKRWPGDVTAWANLGDLYTNFKVDYPKAEENYKTAIRVNPSFIPGYRALHDLYRVKYKAETMLAAGVLKDGLTNNPGNFELLIVLSDYYIQKEMKAEAKAYLEQALAAAEPAGRGDMAPLIQAELDKLNQ